MSINVSFALKILYAEGKKNLLQNFVLLNARLSGKKENQLKADQNHGKIINALFVVNHITFHFVIETANFVLGNVITLLYMIDLRIKIIGIGKEGYLQKIKNFENQKDIETGDKKYLLEMVLFVRCVVKKVVNLRQIIFCLGQSFHKKDLLLKMEEHYV